MIFYGKFTFLNPKNADKEQIEIVHIAFKPWLIELGYETEDSINKILSYLYKNLEGYSM